MAVLVVVNNPFDRNDKEVSEIDGGLAIFHLLNTQDEDIEYVVALNGKITEDYAYIIKQNDSIAIVPIPKGGDGGTKQTIAMVAMIALAIAAPAAGLAMVNAIGATTALGYGAAMGIMYGTQMAVMLAGGMLVSALTPTPSATTATNSTLNEVSPTYAFTGGSNAKTSGTTLPVMLGTARVTPPIIGSYISLDGDKQYINILMAANDGEVDSITDIEVNGQAIDNFTNIEYYTTPGIPSQTAIGNFRDSVTTLQVSRNLNVINTPTTYTTAGNTIQELEVVMSLPSGLFEIKDDGSYISHPVSFDIEYKLSSSSTWSKISRTITSVYKTSKRLAYKIPNLTKGTYDIKVTRKSAYNENTRVANAITFDYINEIVYDDFSYPSVALLSVNALATDQLNGSFPVITCKVANESSVIDSTSAAISLSNPAWACYNLLKREGIPDTDINLVKFQDWAHYCETEGFTVGLYIDSQQELQSALNMVSLLGRAAVVQMGSVFTPIVDNVVDIPTQSFLFTSGNIQEGSFNLGYVPYNDRSNTIEVTYYDEEDNYTAKTVQVQSHDFDSTTTEIKSAISLYGCTKREIALRYAQSLLNKNRYLSETVTFTADIDAIACGVGDVIKVGVQHMTNTMASGRIYKVASNSIVLDQEVELSQNVTYELQLRTEYDEIVIFDYFHSAANTTTDTLLISNSLVVSNPKNIVFAFGTQSTESTNLYRVTNISRANDFKRKITALEYNASVYDDNVAIELEETSIEILETRNIKISENIIYNDEGSAAKVLNISWDGFKITNTIFVGGVKVGTSETNNFIFVDQLIKGDVYEIKVNKTSTLYTYQGLNDDMSVVQNVTSSYANGKTTLTWDKGENVAHSHYELTVNGETHNVYQNFISFYDLEIGTYPVQIYDVGIQKQKSEVTNFALIVSQKPLTKISKDAQIYSESASKFIQDEEGNITGWSFMDGSNLESEFKVFADNFSIGNGIEKYNPFTIEGNNILFNGKVSFTSNPTLATKDDIKATTTVLLSNSTSNDLLIDQDGTNLTLEVANLNTYNEDDKFSIYSSLTYKSGCILSFKINAADTGVDLRDYSQVFTISLINIETGAADLSLYFSLMYLEFGNGYIPSFFAVYASGAIEDKFYEDNPEAGFDECLDHVSFAKNTDGTTKDDYLLLDDIVTFIYDDDSLIVQENGTQRHKAFIGADKSYRMEITTSLVNRAGFDEPDDLIGRANLELYKWERYYNNSNMISEIADVTQSLTALTVSTAQEQFSLNTKILEEAKERAEQDAIIDNKVTDEETARINAITTVQEEYKNYTNIVAKALADEVITTEEQAEISVAWDSVQSAKNRLANIETQLSEIDKVENIDWQTEVQNAINSDLTTIDGGKIVATQLLIDSINALGTIQAAELIADTIYGKKLVGSIIEGAVIRASYLDLNYGLRLLTDYIISISTYNANPSLYIDTVVADNQRRIPTTTEVYEEAQTKTLSNGQSLYGKIWAWKVANVDSNVKARIARPTFISSSNFELFHAYTSFSGQNAGLSVSHIDLSVKIGGVEIARMQSSCDIHGRVTFLIQSAYATNKTVNSGYPKHGLIDTISSSVLFEIPIFRLSIVCDAISRFWFHGGDDSTYYLESINSEITATVQANSSKLPFDWNSGRIEIKNNTANSTVVAKLDPSLYINNMIG